MAKEGRFVSREVLSDCLQLALFGVENLRERQRKAWVVTFKVVPARWFFQESGTFVRLGLASQCGGLYKRRIS
jgi:hypothetical protein